MINQKNETSADHVQHLIASGKPQEALDLCRQLCQTADSQPEDWLLYGCLSADIGESATARMALEKATTLAPDFVEAWFALGKLLAADDPVSAVVPLEKAAQLQPDNADIWLALGITCGLAKQPTMAEQYCRQSLALRPETAYALCNLANALQAQGKLREAETEYEATLQIEPDMVAAWSMLAQARVGLGKFDEAEMAANRALAIAPNMGEAHYTHGLISQKLGAPTKALHHFRKAVEFMPGVLEARWCLGKVLMELKEFAEAAEIFHGLLTIDPWLPKVHSEMGFCFYEQKMHGRAENCFRKALALNNDDFDAHLGIALVAKSMKRNDEYEKHLVESLRIDPTDGQVLHLLATLRGETPPTAPADYVRNIFDGYADNFDAHLVGALNYRTPELLQELVTRQMAPADNSLDVIDLGCGTGLCGPLFRRMARTLHGVDLAPRMIEKARAGAHYDTLEVGDIITPLKSQTAAWDLALSADVFVYVGALEEVFAACATALKPNGHLAFSIEAGDDCDSFVLRNSGRYAHSTSYIQALSAAYGFEVIERSAAALRKEGLEDMKGYLFLMRRIAEAPH